MCDFEMGTKEWESKLATRIEGATYVNEEKEEGLTTNQKTLLARIRTGGYSTEFGWYRWFVIRSKEKPEDPTCPRCGEEEDTASHILDSCPAPARG